jgi:1-acyl-sn-glycerol-3-phosphate acyltransferase
MKVRMRGRLSRKRDLLVISNHASYLDIVALGSKLKANFVAKADVRKWPVFGYIAALGSTIFINRSRMKATGEMSMLERELATRKIPLVIFPEGTSDNGNVVLPFKSSLFSLFEDGEGNIAAGKVAIQPVSMAYTRRGRRALRPEERAHYAWPLEDKRSLIEHLWNVLKNAPFTVEIEVHPFIDISGCRNRKELAALAWEAVNAGFNKLIGGENAGK